MRPSAFPTMRFRSGWTRPRCCCTQRMSLLEALPPDSIGMRSPAGLAVVVGAWVVDVAVAGGSVVVPGAAEDAPPGPSPPQPAKASATTRVSAAGPPALEVRLRVRELPARSSAPDRPPKAHPSRARLTVVESLEPITSDAKTLFAAGWCSEALVPAALLAGGLVAAREDRDCAERDRAEQGGPDNQPPRRGADRGDHQPDADPAHEGTDDGRPRRRADRRLHQPPSPPDADQPGQPSDREGDEADHVTEGHPMLAGDGDQDRPLEPSWHGQDDQRQDEEQDEAERPPH